MGGIIVFNVYIRTVDPKVVFWMALIPAQCTVGLQGYVDQVWPVTIGPPVTDLLSMHFQGL